MNSEATIKCCVCMDYLDRNFVTYWCSHSYCSTCEPGLRNRCAICRKTNLIAIDQDDKEWQDPTLLSAVLSHPRTMACGDVVGGLDAADAHAPNCIKCVRMKCEELEKECKAHVRSRNKLEEDFEELGAELLATQEQLNEVEEENRVLKRRRTLVCSSPPKRHRMMRGEEEEEADVTHSPDFTQSVSRALF